MSETDYMDSYLFSAILQVSVAFPRFSNITSSSVLHTVITDIENNRIEYSFFDTFISQSLVVKKFGKATKTSILNYMKEIALGWIQFHSELIDSVQPYYKHCLGRTAKGMYYYMVSSKEYMICTVQPSVYTSSSRGHKLCSVKKSSNPHHISLSFSRPIEEIANNTLLILFDTDPEHFAYVSHDWLELQKLVQDLYLECSSNSNDLSSEALVQKITRIFVQDGVLVPRYYNVQRKGPDSDVYWKYSPFYPNSNKNLRSLLLSICEHLQKEPSAYIFLQPVDNTQYPAYRRIISNPMDLQTVQRRILNNYYRDYSTFHRDVMQIFWNGCTFNPCNDIWYQQCVVFKLCYMHIYKELKAQGIVDCLPDSQLYDDSIIGGVKKEDGSISCYTSASSGTCHTIAQNHKKIEHFTNCYFGEYCGSDALLSYPLRLVTKDYNAENDDEISLKKGEYVYVTNNETETMVEVMKMDLVELGLFPVDHLEVVHKDGFLKRLREEKEIKEIKIVKRGKLLDVSRLAEATPTNPIPIQTQYSEFIA